MKRFHLYRSIGEEEVGKLMRSISSSPRGQAINFSSMVFVLINSMISRAAFGEVIEDQNEFLSLIREQMELDEYFLVPAIFPSLGFLQGLVGVKPAIKKLHQRMEKVLENIHKSHNVRKKLDDNSREEDFFDVLANLQATAGLGFSITNNTINAIILDIIGEATENPSVTIEWAMSELLRNPRVMKKAQEEVRRAFRSKGRIEDINIQEMHYLIKETLRLHPVIPFIPRESREICEIGGYEIPLKTKVIINSLAICRDPNIWVEPDCFLPERFLDSSISFHGLNYEYTTFGAGKRMCLGRSFAMLSIELTLAHLLCHFDWKLRDGIAPEELDMTEIFAVVCGRKNHLHIIPTPYIPST